MPAHFQLVARGGHPDFLDLPWDAADMYQPWVEKWGPPPSPLLWSHAMYLTLASSLR